MLKTARLPVSMSFAIAKLSVGLQPQLSFPPRV
jgi:hypothetical protein